MEGNVGHPRRRTAKACEYCRQKKLKCDANQPACHNCSVHGKECVQAALVHKTRPTKRRIQELEDEISQLRGKVQRLSPSYAPSTAPVSVVRAETTARSHTSPRQERDSSHSESRCVHGQPRDVASATSDESRGDWQPPLNVAEGPKNDTTKYHGPTSALFDLSHRYPSRELGRADLAAHNVQEDEQYTEYMLRAESSRQRHLEPINLGQGKLDFDNVDESLAMHLLGIYWSRHLHCGLIVYRPMFMRDMACGGPYFSKLLLNAMLFSASKHSSRTEIRSDPGNIATAGWLFRQRFTQLLTNEFAKSNITTIQGLLIMAASLFSRCDERSTSWLYAGHAFNMIVDLGLHVSSTTRTNDLRSAQYSEIRKRIFWGAYILDKTQCLLQGRPSILRISDANVPMSFNDSYEDLEAFDNTSFTAAWSHGAVPLYYTSSLRSSCALSIVMERILTNIYGGNYTVREPQNFYWDSMALQLELSAWRKDQPHYIDFITLESANPPLPHHMTLMALYNVLIILLRRPLIVEQQTSPPRVPSHSDLAYESFTTCLSAAKEIVHILQVYSEHYPIATAPYVISYAAYIGATILVRDTALRGSKTTSKEGLDVCLEALEQHQHLYAAASQAKAAINALMQRMSIGLDETYMTRAQSTGRQQVTNERQDQASQRHPGEEDASRQHASLDLEQTQATNRSITRDMSCASQRQQQPHFTNAPLEDGLSVAPELDGDDIIKSFAVGCPLPLSDPLFSALESHIFDGGTESPSEHREFGPMPGPQQHPDADPFSNILQTSGSHRML